ncbi:MAG: hypothetical protein V8S30_04030 [Merdibacter sp.]
MYFTETKALREMEKMMRLIPNFPQRGHGVVLLHGGNRIRDDCSFCMHRRDKPPDVICVYDNSCIAQRIRCGNAAPAEVFRETLYAASSPLFQKRLGQYIKESEDKPMDYRNEKHRAVFEDFIRKKDRNNQALMSALYLLTADFMLWRCVKYAVVNNAICFEQVRLHGTNTNSYPLFCAAKDLYLGTRNLTVSELADKSLVTPKVFGLICNAMAIRRFGLGALENMKRGDSK